MNYLKREKSKQSLKTHYKIVKVNNSFRSDWEVYDADNMANSHIYENVKYLRIYFTIENNTLYNQVIHDEDSDEENIYNNKGYGTDSDDSFIFGYDSSGENVKSLEVEFNGNTWKDLYAATDKLICQANDVIGSNSENTLNIVEYINIIKGFSIEDENVLVIDAV